MCIPHHTVVHIKYDVDLVGTKGRFYSGADEAAIVGRQHLGQRHGLRVATVVALHSTTSLVAFKQVGDIFCRARQTE